MPISICDPGIFSVCRVIGCAPQLGCTIFLRGGKSCSAKKLERVATVLLFGSYVAHSVRQENCFLRNEFAVVDRTAVAAEAAVVKRMQHASKPTSATPTTTAGTSSAAAPKDVRATTDAATIAATMVVQPALDSDVSVVAKGSGGDADHDSQSPPPPSAVDPSNCTTPDASIDGLNATVVGTDAMSTPTNDASIPTDDASTPTNTTNTSTNTTTTPTANTTVSIDAKSTTQEMASPPIITTSDTPDTPTDNVAEGVVAGETPDVVNVATPLLGLAQVDYTPQAKFLPFVRVWVTHFGKNTHSTMRIS